MPLHTSSEPEHTRLENQHETLVGCMNGVTVHAPVTSPKQIVDVGCGTGVVTCCLGERFPDALVWGIDLSPVPVMHHQKPNNVTFVRGDFLTLVAGDGRFAKGSTDLIFSRLLVFGMTDWQRYIETAASMLKPGGYMEVQEVERKWYSEGQVISEDCEWMKAYFAALQSKGLDPYCAEKLDGWMRDAGLEAVQVKRFAWPFTKQQRDMYQWLLPKILAGQGHSEEKIKMLTEQAAKTTDVQGMYKMFRVTVGQKRW